MQENLRVLDIPQKQKSDLSVGLSCKYNKKIKVIIVFQQPGLFTMSHCLDEKCGQYFLAVFKSSKREHSYLKVFLGIELSSDVSYLQYCENKEFCVILWTTSSH